MRVAVLASRESGGQTIRQTTRFELPAGQWHDPFSGERVTGGGTELPLEGGRVLVSQPT